MSVCVPNSPLLLFLRFPFVAVSVPQISDHISPESLPFRFGGVLEGKFLLQVSAKGWFAPLSVRWIKKKRGFDGRGVQNY